MDWIDSAAEALARVRAAALPGAEPVTAVCDEPVVIATEPLAAEVARDVWAAARARRDSLGLSAVVVDAAVALEIDAGAAADALAAAASIRPDDFVAARRRARKRFWIDYLAQAEEAAAAQQPEPEAEAPAPPGDDTPYAELARRFRRLGLSCPERDPFADEQAKLAELPADIAARQGPPGDFYYVVRDRQLAASGLDVDPLRARVVFVAAPPSAFLAYLGYGGSSQCPAAADHVALQRSWAERFGAELAFVGPDTLEVAVERPPATASALRELAFEHFVYCSDIVYQGAGSLDALATALAGSRRWFFWWD